MVGNKFESSLDQMKTMLELNSKLITTERVHQLTERNQETLKSFMKSIGILTFASVSTFALGFAIFYKKKSHLQMPIKFAGSFGSGLATCLLVNGVGLSMLSQKYSDELHESFSDPVYQALLEETKEKH